MALAAVVIALGSAYWLVRDRDVRQAAGESDAGAP